MTDSIWVNIAETPWWAYVLFIYFLYLGFLATKPRIITLRQLFLLPGVFIIFSLIFLVILVPITLANFFLWLGMLVLGMLLGWLHFRIKKIKAIQNQFSFYVPGTWSFFIVIFTLIAIKYYSGYQFAFNPTFFSQPKNISILFLLYGLGTGLLLGRLAYSCYCLKVGPYLEQLIS